MPTGFYYGMTKSCFDESFSFFAPVMMDGMSNDAVAVLSFFCVSLSFHALPTTASTFLVSTFACHFQYSTPPTSADFASE